MDQSHEFSTAPTIFRSSWVRWVELVAMGLMAIAGGALLLVTTGDGSTLTFPVLAPIVAGTLALLLGLHHIVRPAPDLVVDDQAVTLSPFGRMPWAAIARVHVITAHGARYLAIEPVESSPKLTRRRWPRWVYGPVGRFTTGYPMTISERWLRPISLDDIAVELQARHPDLVIERSERGFWRANSRRQQRS
ncbi:hypothetical protein [Nocardia sp. NPDC056100]|uniref:hypothetical protein n=1 Tax=Nocardia sp. NPDC056100 TaxID=3345712 RepID=UPI0035DFBCED